jgi:uncharacterized protein YdhG (YjbR/CyaY superfamily)
MAKFTSVDAYIASLPEDRRGAMEALRQAVREAAPNATEAISYNMPALKVDGKFLVSYAAFKRHISLFPWSDEMLEALGEDLRRHATGRGTIQFPADEPIPLDLVRRVVEFRLKEFTAR